MICKPMDDYVLERKDTFRRKELSVLMQVCCNDTVKARARGGFPHA
jgi:hypothetical protein